MHQCQGKEVKEQGCRKMNIARFNFNIVQLSLIIKVKLVPNLINNHLMEHQLMRFPHLDITRLQRVFDYNATNLFISVNDIFL